jgi:AcrR family transcriptional regulator
MRKSKVTRRLEPKERRDEILSAAVALAAKGNYQNITRDDVAAKAKCSTGLVTKYFSTMTQLKRAVMREAVAKGNVKVIAQGLADKNPHARKAAPVLREKAAALLAA